MPKKAKKSASKSTQSSARKKKNSKVKKARKKAVSPVTNVVRQSANALKIRKVEYTKRKLGIVLGNLTFFIILFVVSAILYSISTSAFYNSLFFMLSLVFGVFSIALLIVLLIFVFLKMLK